MPRPGGRLAHAGRARRASAPGARPAGGHALSAAWLAAGRRICVGHRTPSGGARRVGQAPLGLRGPRPWHPPHLPAPLQPRACQPGPVAPHRRHPPGLLPRDLLCCGCMRRRLPVTSEQGRAGGPGPGRGTCLLSGGGWLTARWPWAALWPHSVPRHSSAHGDSALWARRLRALLASLCGTPLRRCCASQGTAIACCCMLTWHIPGACLLPAPLLLPPAAAGQQTWLLLG